MPILFLENLTECDKTRTVEKLMKESNCTSNFILMTCLSMLMAALGIAMNNIPVVIGSMLISPVLFPVLSLSLGIVMADIKLIGRSFFAIVKSIAAGLALVLIFSLFINFQLDGPDSLIHGFHPSLIYFVVAFIAGLAASFALAKPEVSETLPGVAISVALIPPLAAVGIGMVNLNWEIISGALKLFLLNIVGITFSSMLFFSMMNFYVKKKVVQCIIKEEEKEKKDQKEKKEKAKEKEEEKKEQEKEKE